MEFLYALIASVCQTRYVFLYGYFAPLEQFEVVLAALADGDTDYLAALMRDDELGFLGMALFLPAVISPLFFCGRSTGLSADIDKDYGKLRALVTQLLLARHMKCFALDEYVFSPLHRAVHDGCGDSPRESDMEVGAILPPVLECHEELVLKRELWRSSWFDFPLLVLSEDMQHVLEGLWRHTAGTLEVFPASSL